VLFDKTYVASLWPFGLMEIKKLRSVERLANWFDERRIHAPDWPEIKNRISLRVDGAGAHFVNIELA
jgi:hypothetical protein